MESEQAYFNDVTPDGTLSRLMEEIKGLGNVVGVVGFSMGAKVGMEVVRRLQAEGDDGRVKFFLACCGTVPFQGGDETARKAGRKESEGRDEAFKDNLAKGVVKAESMHLIGEGDPWRAESERLVEFFAEEKRRVVRFRGEHHMPVDDAVNRQVVRIMLAACKGSV